MPFGTEEQGHSLIEKGARFLAGGSEINIIMKAFQEKKRLFDRLQEICIKGDF